jgi:hypothetical protein
MGYFGDRQPGSFFDDEGVDGLFQLPLKKCALGEPHPRHMRGAGLFLIRSRFDQKIVSPPGISNRERLAITQLPN